MTIHEKLAAIQAEVRVPKDQYNSFGKYYYRNAESILEAARPLLDGATLTLSDDVVEVGDRIYVKATATLSFADQHVSVSAFAREPLARKGMDEAQVTGASSSYARKTALGGLLALTDSSNDPDATNDYGLADRAAAKKKPAKLRLSDLCGELVGVADPAVVDRWLDVADPALPPLVLDFATAKQAFLRAGSRDDIAKQYKGFKDQYLSGKMDGELEAVAVMLDQAAQLSVERLKEMK